MPRTEDETEVSFLRRLQLCVAPLCGMLALAVAGPAQAETGEVRAAQQLGVTSAEIEEFGFAAIIAGSL